jgi:hypothetical protein
MLPVGLLAPNCALTPGAGKSRKQAQTYQQGHGTPGHDKRLTESFAVSIEKDAQTIERLSKSTDNGSNSAARRNRLIHNRRSHRMSHRYQEKPSLKL